MAFWCIWVFLAGLLCCGGVIDCRNHRRHVQRIKLRININGTRGKSTVTRLLTGALKEAGIKVIGKTTGTAARLIYWFKDEEEQIKRRPCGPSIGEQIGVMRKAAALGAECLVNECMAVNPEYQEIFAGRLLVNNVGVIVNTLPDHLDVMGPTTKEAAEALASTIPWHGTVILIKDEFYDFYAGVAAARQCRVCTAEPEAVPRAYLDQFSYLVFPANVALALEAALQLGVEREVALRGMLKATPDPGVLTIKPVRIRDKDFLFANAFAANDPVSTLMIHEQLQGMGYGRYPLVVIVNCREDRADRTKQLTEEVLTRIFCTCLVAVGRGTGYVRRGYERGWIHTKTFWDLEGMQAEQVLAGLAGLPEGSLILGIGNIHGTAEALVEKLNAGQRAIGWQMAWRRSEVADF